jgi:hypothetical protein
LGGGEGVKQKKSKEALMKEHRKSKELENGDN